MPMQMDPKGASNIGEASLIFVRPRCGGRVIRASLRRKHLVGSSARSHECPSLGHLGPSHKRTVVQA